MPADNNAEQIAEWNGVMGQQWAGMQRETDAVVAPFGNAALHRAAPRPGERVIDIGCGCGDTSIEIARRVGERGTVLGVGAETVRAMAQAYGCRPADIQAAIGPAIGPDHYEVGQDVLEQVRYCFGDDSAGLIHEYAGQPHFDLWAANKLILQQAGVEQVEAAGLCTACHPDDWYSHRAQKGKTGRFGVLMALAENSSRHTPIDVE